MKRLYILFLLGAIFFDIHAQISVPFQRALWRGSETNVEGSPFLEENWNLGTVTDTRNDKVYRVFLKYDTHIDRIVVNSNYSPVILDESRYPIFTMNQEDDKNNPSRQFVNANQLGLIGLEGYYEVLYEGKYILLQKTSTNYIPNTIPEYGTNRKVILYLTKDDRYLINPGNEVLKVPSREKVIFPLFNENETIARSIATTENLSIDKQEDFIKLLEKLDKQL